MTVGPPSRVAVRKYLTMALCSKCGIELILHHELAAGKCITCMLIEQQDQEAKRE